MIFEAKFKRPFVNFVKKQHRPLQAVIEDEVLAICDDPGIGESKIGDLVGIRVREFTFKKQEYLIAYSVPGCLPTKDAGERESMKSLAIDFLLIGTHENFYNELKGYLKAAGWYS